MAMVSMTVRIEERIKEGLRELAEREGRSMAGYLEWMIEREYNTLKNGLVNLESLDKKLDILLNSILENKKRTRRENNQQKKLTAFDAWEDNGVCSKERWEQWVNHVRKVGAPLNHGSAVMHFQEFCRHDAEGYNCNTLIKEITERYPWKFPYIPNDWKRNS